MAKVTIKGLKKRTIAKDHSKVTPLHKPASKPGVGGYSYAKNITAKQDKAYNSKQM
jgi:hypothetical protein